MRKILAIGLFAFLASATPAFSQAAPVGGGGTVPSSTCGDSGHALAWNGTAYTCQAITGGSAAAGGSTTQVQRNNGGAIDGISGVTSDGTSVTVSSGNLKLSGSSSGTSIVNAPATGGGTLTLPPGTDTIAGIAATQTLTNKSIDAGQLTGSIVAARMPALTGDITTSAGAVATTLATVNSNVGTFGDATHCANFTVNGKGLITAAAQSTSCPGGGGGSVSITSGSNNLVVSPNPLTGTGTISATFINDARTTTTETITAANAGELVTGSNASAQAFTLPGSNSGGGFAAGYSTEIMEIGAGALTPSSTSTFFPGTPVLAKGQSAGFTSLGATGWLVDAVSLPIMAQDTVLGNAAAANYPTALSLPSCANDGAHASIYATASHAWVCAAISGGSATSVTVGTTTVGSGTTTKVLFDNVGVLGEYTISGSGNVAMTTSAVFTTPNLGVPSAITLTNATGCAISSCVSGLGTSVATALGVNVGSAGAFTKNNAANVWSAQQSNSVTALSVATTTFTPDGTNNNYSFTLVTACATACTVANPSATPVAGTAGVFLITQFSGGGKTITWGSQYIAAGGSSTVQPDTTGSSINAVSFFVIDATHILIAPAALNATH